MVPRPRTPACCCELLKQLQAACAASNDVLCVGPTAHTILNAGWDLFENARAPAGFPAIFAAITADADEDCGLPHAGTSAYADPTGAESLAQDWSWLDTLAEQK